MIGRTLSHYRILEQIGAGGMGEVYRARDERLGRDVAVKVLPASAFGDEAARKRFHREAQALIQLAHPHIAVLHDFDSCDGIDFIVMELIPGETLSERIGRGPLPETEVRRLGAQAAQALAAAHGHGVLHCDLKPSNIRLTPDVEVKVLDFGLAKLASGTGAATSVSTATQSAELTGTLPYLAPEQLLGGSATARSDIYALGVVLYEMATGSRPFGDKAPAALAHDIAFTPAPAPRARRPELSEGLERVILRALEKDPDRRHPSASALGAELLRGSAAPTPAGAARRRLARIAPALAGIAGGGILALALLFNVAGLRERLFGPPAAAIQSLAVLPLANLSGDPEQEYFSDGMTEELISCLAQVTSLRVISRSSVMQLKGSKEPLDRIASRLGVAHLVEGSVERSGSRVKISAELVGVGPERVLWARSYEGTVENVNGLQGEVAQAIVQEVRARLSPHERARLAAPRRIDPAAHEAYLKGRYLATGRNIEKLRKANDYFMEAARIDPQYAVAWAGVALGNYTLSNISLPPREAMPRAKTAAERAIALDPDLADGYAWRGYCRMVYDFDLTGAERDYALALERNPSLEEAHQFKAAMLMYTGRFDESVEEFHRAEQLDPFAFDLAGQIGWCLYFKGSYREAAEAFWRYLDLDPKSPDTRTWLGLCHLRLGERARAFQELRRAAETADHAWPRAQLGWAYAFTGQRAEAERVLERLLHPPAGEIRNACCIALVYAGLGDADRAMEWLEKSYAERGEDLLGLKVEPAWTSLRADPRFQDLLRRLNLAS